MQKFILSLDFPLINDGKFLSIFFLDIIDEEKKIRLQRVEITFLSNDKTIDISSPLYMHSSIYYFMATI